MKKLILIGLLAGCTGFTSAFGKDRYDQWLKEEVVWIVGKKEKKQFESLGTDEERDAFIEQFWLDRDPTPRTPENEYKEQHYERLKYVNERFHEGNLPGWKTDRGRVYIIHGPPNSRNAQMEAEMWTYNSNPNARYYQGSLVLQFQRGGSTYQSRAISESAYGQARMQRYDAGDRNSQKLFAQTDRWRLIAAGPGLGPGGAIITSSGETDRYIGDLLRSPGDVLEEKKEDEARRRETWKDLQASVTSEYTFGELNLSIKATSFFRDEDRFVYFDAELPFGQLEFKKESGFRVARIDVFCEIRDLEDNYQVDKIDETVSVVNPDDNKKQELLRYSDRFRVQPGDYRLKCVIQDVETKKIGLETLELDEEEIRQDKLALSSLLFLQEAYDAAEPGLPVELYPLQFLGLRFPAWSSGVIDPQRPLYLYFEIYNHRNQDGTPRNLFFNYKLYDDEQIHLKLPMQRFEPGDGDAMALMFDVSKLPPGEYSFLLKVIDSGSKDYDMKMAKFLVDPGGD